MATPPDINPREPAELSEFEQRVVRALHDARDTVRAPAGLRARIEAQRPSRRTVVRRRAGYAGAFAGALAAVVLALVLILPAGTPGAPSVSQAAGLAILGPAAPAPTPDSTTAGKLQTQIEEVYFPNWSGRFGWQAVGQRTDHIGGRLAITVYYDWQGHRIAYTIVGAPALAAPAAQVTTLNRTELRTLTVHGRLVVTWRRAGHTCVLSGAGVPVSELQKLAAWQAPGVST